MIRLNLLDHGSVEFHSRQGIRQRGEILRQLHELRQRIRRERDSLRRLKSQIRDVPHFQRMQGLPVGILEFWANAVLKRCSLEGSEA